MLRVGCKHLDRILFTPEHADHSPGIDDIRPFFFKQGNIPLYATDRVVNDLSRRFSYIFQTDNKYPGTLAVDIHTIQKNTVFALEGKKVIPIEVMHNQLPVMGFRIDDFAYLTDVKSIDNDQL